MPAIRPASPTSPSPSLPPFSTPRGLSLTWNISLRYSFHLISFPIINKINYTPLYIYIFRNEYLKFIPENIYIYRKYVIVEKRIEGKKKRGRRDQVSSGVGRAKRGRERRGEEGRDGVVVNRRRGNNSSRERTIRNHTSRPVPSRPVPWRGRARCI